MNKNSNIIRIPSTKERLFLYWFEFLKPYNKLTSTECKLAARLLSERFELEKIIKDDDLVDSTMLSNSKKFIGEGDLTQSHYYFLMGVLKRKKVIVNNKFNKKLIPNISENSKDFQLIFYFDLKE